MLDKEGRKIDYMRISITDRCNLRCGYCMPDGIECVPMEEILTYEEIVTVCKAAVELGVTRFKITGGEPLVRKGCPGLIESIKNIPGVEQVTMTTNGILLGKYLKELSRAGLDAINISIDSLNPEKFYGITGGGDLAEVLSGLDAAVEEGFRVKINCLLQRRVNEDEWKDFINLADEKDLAVRFIEMMPIGRGNMEEGISNRTLAERMHRVYPEIVPDMSCYGNGPAVYYKIPGKNGSIGFISAIHGKFCKDCNRIRLTAKGRIKPCLCYSEGLDIKDMLRNQQEASYGHSYGQIRGALEKVIWNKPKGHCFGNENQPVSETAPMVQIGG